MDRTVFAKVQLRGRRKMSDTSVVFFQPTLDPASETGTWMCCVEISPVDESSESISGFGIDPLQALLNAVTAARTALKARSRDLTVFSGDDDWGALGLPLIVDGRTEFVELIERTVELEHLRTYATRLALTPRKK